MARTITTEAAKRIAREALSDFLDGPALKAKSGKMAPAVLILRDIECAVEAEADRQANGEEHKGEEHAR